MRLELCEKGLFKKSMKDVCIKEIEEFLYGRNSFNEVETICKVLDHLDLNIDSSKVILVAGTNGKGSTCATLATLLLKSKKNVGFFSSPHLVRVNERIKFNLCDISDKDFCDLFEIVHAASCDLELSLSFFEYMTLMAAYYFFRVKSADVSIFEVGLGGTLDATNAIPHDICIITRFGMDHTHILGDSIVSIAQNKFGIIKRKSVVFHTAFDDLDVQELAKQYAIDYESKFIKAYDYSFYSKNCEEIPRFFIDTKFGSHEINLNGKRGAENTALAITAFDYLMNGSETEKYLSFLKEVVWPGRMDLVKIKGVNIFLSGDHNKQGISSLLELISHYKYNKIHFIVGVCNDKDHEGMLNLLLGVRNSRLYITETTERTRHIDEYGSFFLSNAVYADVDPMCVIEKAISNANDDDMIVVTGSLYLVGHVLKQC